MRIEEYDYNLPKELIAQEPLRRRDSSKLLVYHKKSDIVEHVKFRDVVKFFSPGDVVVVNKTKVIKTRLDGKKESGGKVEITVVEKFGERSYRCFLKIRKPRLGMKVLLKDGTVGIIKKMDGAFFTLEFSRGLEPLLKRHGRYAIPPYIKKAVKNEKRYQTVFAREEGSISAPTAGLHFTEGILKKLKRKGVEIAKVCLHVGYSTFMPIRVSDYRRHRMHEEYFKVDEHAARVINERKGNLFVVGTTSLRAIESASKKGKVIPCEGFTDLFIYPGYKFKNKIHGFITNFHLPRTTLLLLVAAFVERKKLLELYEEAKKMKYRFYSFGDAMLILDD